MLKAIIFDLDQTLVNRTATFKAFIKSQHLRFNSEITCDESTYMDTMFLFDNNGYKDKQTMFAEVCAHLNLSIDPDILFDDFKQHYGSVPILFDGVLETLDELQQNYRLAIITNGRVKAQTTKIRVSGLEKYFEVVTISEAVGIKKPAPEIFQHCLSQLKLPPQECIYIGDNPINDVKAAMGVGMKAIWVKTPHFEPPVQCHGVLEKFEDLQKTITAM
ncbi:MAG: HAD family hydrolase [Akkermansiaceae bacterium]